MTDRDDKLISYVKKIIGGTRWQVTDTIAQKLLDRIAELEKDVSNPKGLWVTSKDLQAWKLEQQANACDRIIEMATISKLHSPYMITRDSVIDERDDLRNQAESLKEDK
jgi:predicted class III extradiol MEMO1 family dioxygenase